MQAYSGAALRNCRMRALFFVILSGSLFSPLFADTSRPLPVDLFVVIDGSAALEQGRNEAIDWLCGRVVDGLLREGDSLTVWVAGEEAEELCSVSIAGKEAKDAAKALIRSIPAGAKNADFAGALREAARREGGSAGDSGRLACALLISGMASGYNSLSGGEMPNLLRYSRFEEFPAWRAVTVAPGIGSAVKNTAADFMR
ncbi:MAG: hypothetical protein LBI91_07590 [Spirochaetaceae bacterium]|jgi:hypothetical protein|nr:hypothetical protein [Spirochaetaceae bacterium]